VNKGRLVSDYLKHATLKFNRKVKGDTMTINTSTKNRLAGLLTATVLGMSAAASFSTIAVADPRHESKDVKAARKDVKEARKDVKRERKDLRKADTTQERREERHDVREAKKDVKEARHDVRTERREDRNGNNSRWNNGYHSGNGYSGNSNNSNRNGHNSGYNNGSSYSDSFRTFTGTVTKVSNNRFDIRVGNTTYNVASSSRLPRNLDRGDIVRVYGQRFGQNDIRNASVSMINNR
jgi:hypothetical protein